VLPVCHKRDDKTSVTIVGYLVILLAYIAGHCAVVPGTVSEGLNGWSEALTAGLAVWTANMKAPNGVGVGCD